MKDGKEMYYAKSKRQDGSQPTVAEHLDAVSARAAEYGEEVGMKEQARIAGLTHDLGKCNRLFQEHPPGGDAAGAQMESSRRC